MASQQPTIRVPVELDVQPPQLAELIKALVVAHRGDVIVLEVADHVSDDEIHQFSGALGPVRERTGVEFVVLSSGVRLARIERDGAGPTS